MTESTNDNAEAGKELGIEMARRRAEKIRVGWTNDAVQMIGRYAQHIGAPFLVEDARVWAYKQGLDEPPSISAWGAVPRRAAKLGLIHHSGTMSPTKSRGGHKDEKVVWNPGEGTASAPHSRRDVFAMAATLRVESDGLKKHFGLTALASAMLLSATMLENLAPRA